MLRVCETSASLGFASKATLSVRELCSVPLHHCRMIPSDVTTSFGLAPYRLHPEKRKWRSNIFISVNGARSGGTRSETRYPEICPRLANVLAYRIAGRRKSRTPSKSQSWLIRNKRKGPPQKVRRSSYAGGCAKPLAHAIRSCQFNASFLRRIVKTISR